MLDPDRRGRSCGVRAISASTATRSPAGAGSATGWVSQETVSLSSATSSAQDSQLRRCRSKAARSMSSTASSA